MYKIVFNPNILNPSYNKNIFINRKNDYIVKTEYLGNNIYKENYYECNNLDYMIKHKKNNIINK